MFSTISSQFHSYFFLRKSVRGSTGRAPVKIVHLQKDMRNYSDIFELILDRYVRNKLHTYNLTNKNMSAATQTEMRLFKE